MNDKVKENVVTEVIEKDKVSQDTRVPQATQATQAPQPSTTRQIVKPLAKTLRNSDKDESKDNVKDLTVFNGDLFKLLSKASSESEGWMKSTKAMDVIAGCVVQVTTQQRNPDGTYCIAEALTFVPGVKIKELFDEHKECKGRVLAKIG